jgi:transposase
MTIPGVAELLALTIASEIGDISRFPSPRKLVGYAGLAPRVKQSGQRSHTGRLSKAGPATLRWAAVEASQHGCGRPSLGTASTATSSAATARPTGQVRRRSQGPDRLLAHPVSQRAVQAERFQPPILSRQAPPFVWPPDGPQMI